MESTSSEEDEGPEEISSKPKGLEKPDEHEILDEVCRVIFILLDSHHETQQFRVLGRS